ncbi:hypothetical protein [Bradyrhizobium sp. 17]|uniref:hypothetical protein n=1 Tax=Bradyrhizobium sp. 17 TaxID=2782649 RepID=UPI001FFA6FE1|nr:hypothetical protein [Bradyrhizobium sp. 17]MCK1520198.1 hypothetical protein [Bradyrhizobium sp. 17]
MALALKDVDALLDDLAVTMQNKTAESAAQIAKVYGASDEVVQAILRLKTKEKAA